MGRPLTESPQCLAGVGVPREEGAAVLAVVRDQPFSEPLLVSSKHCLQERMESVASSSLQRKALGASGGPPRGAEFWMLRRKGQAAGRARWNTSRGAFLGPFSAFF